MHDYVVSFNTFVFACLRRNTEDSKFVWLAPVDRDSKDAKNSVCGKRWQKSRGHMSTKQLCFKIEW